jgi:hypothetical protein
MKKDITEFTIDVKMQSRWVPHFVTMLKYMQFLGDVGSSRHVTLFSDGDGDFRPKFEFSIDPERVEPVDGNKSGEHVYDAG